MSPSVIVADNTEVDDTSRIAVMARGRWDARFRSGWKSVFRRRWRKRRANAVQASRRSCAISPPTRRGAFAESASARRAVAWASEPLRTRAGANSTRIGGPRRRTCRAVETAGRSGRRRLARRTAEGGQQAAAGGGGRRRGTLRPELSRPASRPTDRRSGLRHSGPFPSDRPDPGERVFRAVPSPRARRDGDLQAPGPADGLHDRERANRSNTPSDRRRPRPFLRAMTEAARPDPLRPRPWPWPPRSGGGSRRWRGRGREGPRRPRPRP